MLLGISCLSGNFPFPFARLFELLYLTVLCKGVVEATEDDRHYSRGRNGILIDRFTYQLSLYVIVDGREELVSSVCCFSKNFFKYFSMTLQLYVKRAYFRVPRFRFLRSFSVLGFYGRFRATFLYEPIQLFLFPFQVCYFQIRMIVPFLRRNQKQVDLKIRFKLRSYMNLSNYSFPFQSWMFPRTSRGACQDIVTKVETVNLSIG